MGKNIECEERLMLTESQYYELISYYKKHFSFSEKDINNYYFDDADLSLIKSHNMLRIRITNNQRYALTLKIKGKDGDAEISQSMTKLSFEEAISVGKLPQGEVLEHLEKLVKNTANIKYIANLHCFRTSFHFNDFLIEIDKNNYLNKLDFDVEVEAKNMQIAKREILKICNDFNVEYKNDYMVKSARVFSTIENSFQQRDHK